jgi:hypothetical protein
VHSQAGSRAPSALCGANLAKDVERQLGLAITQTKQIEIAGWATRIIEAMPHEHGALQNKPFAVWRMSVGCQSTRNLPAVR